FDVATAAGEAETSSRSLISFFFFSSLSFLSASLISFFSLSFCCSLITTPPVEGRIGGELDVATAAGEAETSSRSLISFFFFSSLSFLSASLISFFSLSFCCSLLTTPPVEGRIGGEFDVATTAGEAETSSRSLISFFFFSSLSFLSASLISFFSLSFCCSLITTPPVEGRIGGEFDVATAAGEAETSSRSLISFFFFSSLSFLSASLISFFSLSFCCSLITTPPVEDRIGGELDLATAAGEAETSSRSL